MKKIFYILFKKENSIFSLRFSIWMFLSLFLLKLSSVYATDSEKNNLKEKDQFLYTLSSGEIIDFCLKKYPLRGDDLVKVLNCSYRFEKGINVKKDAPLAFWLYQQASQSGSVIADYALSRLYYTGIGVEKNEKSASFYLLQSAERGHQDAQFKLARCYAFGIQGFPPSELASIQWFKKALKKNVLEEGHQYFCALATFFGFISTNNVKEDYENAFKMLIKSSKGLPPFPGTLFQLGEFYEKGIFLDEDITFAFVYYYKAYHRLLLMLDCQKSQNLIYENNYFNLSLIELKEKIIKIIESSKFRIYKKFFLESEDYIKNQAYPSDSVCLFDPLAKILCIHFYLLNYMQNKSKKVYIERGLSSVTGEMLKFCRNKKHEMEQDQAKAESCDEIEILESYEKVYCKLYRYYCNSNLFFMHGSSEKIHQCLKLDKENLEKFETFKESLNIKNIKQLFLRAELREENKLEFVDLNLKDSSEFFPEVIQNSPLLGESESKKSSPHYSGEIELPLQDASLFFDSSSSSRLESGIDFNPLNQSQFLMNSNDFDFQQITQDAISQFINNTNHSLNQLNQNFQSFSENMKIIDSTVAQNYKKFNEKFLKLDTQLEEIFRSFFEARTQNEQLMSMVKEYNWSREQ